MKFGVTIPNNWGIPDPSDVVAMGPLAEALGFDSIWVMDHLFNNGYIRERLDDAPYYHPLSILSYLSATTQSITLGTSVLVMPYHNPVELAKYSATLDQISGGRLTLGVGVGAMSEEFDALGISLKDRGSLTNESINILKELWTNENPSYSSSRWNFSDLKFSPKPLQKPSIPIWIGGASDGALARAARVGDGWHPSGVDPSAYSVRKQQIEELAESQNRDISHFAWSTRVEVQAHGKPSSERAAQRATLSGDSSDQMINGIAEYESSGTDHIILAINSGDVIRIKELMHTISEEVMPSYL